MPLVMSSQPSNRPPLPDGPYLVVGLARSGEAAAEALLRLGARVYGTDSGNPPGATRLAEAGVELSLDGDGVDFLDLVNAVIKSPGVPSSAPAIAAARERGMPVIGELELGWRLTPNRFIAVTGTNGKTTVTEWLGAVCREAGEPHALAGNVGTPLASLAGTLPADATVVCECSSFQLEDSEAFAPEVAVLLNFSPDHLDRHGTLEDYLGAKLRIFANQDSAATAVIDADEPALAGLELPGDAEVAPYGVDACAEAEGLCAVSAVDGELRDADGVLVRASDLPLAGEHNLRNAMAVAAAALAAGIDRDAVARGLRSFAGVPHRLERVAEIGGVDLRQRLQGHERRRRLGRAPGLRRRGPRDPRRQPQGRRLRGAGARRPRALPGLLPDRRGRAAPRRRPRRRRGAPAPVRRARGGGPSGTRRGAAR